MAALAQMVRRSRPSPVTRAGTARRSARICPGYERAYPTFTRQLRDRRLRPHCEPCSSSNGRAHADIDRQVGVEMQWDWLELDDTPWGVKAYVLVGALSHLGPFRVWFSEADLAAEEPVKFRPAWSEPAPLGSELRTPRRSPNSPALGIVLAMPKST